MSGLSADRRGKRYRSARPRCGPQAGGLDADRGRPWTSFSLYECPELVRRFAGEFVWLLWFAKRRRSELPDVGLHQ